VKPRWLLLLVGLGMLGCLNPRTRLQSPEEGDGKDGNQRVVGDVCGVAVDESEVMGVGLVVGLSGTGGGSPPASSYRTMLEEDMKKRDIKDVQGMLDSPNNTLVIVSTKIPAGTRKNEPLDVQITLPEGSRCTSLRGGFLLECELRAYENVKRLMPDYKGPDRSAQGYVLLKAEGPVMVGTAGTNAGIVRGASRDHNVESAGADETLRVGRVWGGGRCLADPPILLTMNSDQQYSRVAAKVADRINATFPVKGLGIEGIASAKSKSIIFLGIPAHYRHDLPHYLRVVRAIPLDRVPPANSSYRKNLADCLLDPGQSLAAALRLEALGEESVPVLKQAMSAPSPLTRFAAAQSLAYLRKPACAEELARLAREYPILRAHCINAMSSLNESACQTRLVELMRDRDPELRYAAFRGLHRVDERSIDIAGVRLNESFWLHRVAPDSPPMIHYLTARRPEIVLFGDKQTLQAPFRLGFGTEFTITADKEAPVCTIKRFSVRHGQPVRQCSLEVADVLKTLAEIGGSYEDALELLRKADANGRLSCGLFHDALPRAVDVIELAKLGKQDPTLRSAPGSTPTPSAAGQ
jgi:hypothetical protein